VIWCCLSDAVLKLAYAHLKFPHIADSQGSAVAEAFLQVGSNNDDGSAKQLDLAIKLAERKFDRKARGLVQSMVLVVGMAVVGTVVAGVALLVAGTAPGPGPAAASNALMPLGMLLLRGLALLRCEQHLTSLLGTLWPHLALWGQLRF
jgi:hypothetical protein